MSKDNSVHSQVILDPILTYVANSVSNSPIDSIRVACREFYTLTEVNAAKELLWSVGDPGVLPPLIKRRDSAKANEMEKVIEDIVLAIQKLDTAEKLPLFAASHNMLGRIPKASPAEMCPLNVCERLNKVEATLAQVSDLRDRLSRVEHELGSVKEHPESMSYAKVVSESTSPQNPSCTNTTAPAQKTAGINPHKELYVKLPPEADVKRTQSLSQDRGPKTVINKHLNAARGKFDGSMTSLVSNESFGSKPSLYDEGFQYTQDQKRRNRSLRRKKVVTGTSVSNTLQGAPEPSRDLYLYRTVKKTEEKDISSYLCSKGIKERSVTNSRRLSQNV